MRAQSFGCFKRKSFHRIAAVLLAMRAVPCALAEEPVVLPEITVTGQRLGETGAASTATRLPASILDIPRAVNVVPESLIEDRAILDPQEAIQNVSGVQRGFSRTGVGETYTVRGFVQQALFKDGFRAGQSPATFSPFTFEGPTDVANLERIEVLKGPSALLYGRGEPGGTVNYITRTPDQSIPIQV